MLSPIAKGNPAQKILTLCVIHQQPSEQSEGSRRDSSLRGRVLLGMKKRGFGEGRWNGFGGKVKEGEGIVEAAKRELLEESGLEALDILHLGTLEFRWQGKPEILEVNIFKVCRFNGEPRETEEMRPCWFEVKEIPFGQMWQDDKYWFPLFLGEKRFKGKFIFDDNDNVLQKELTEIA